MVPEQHGHCSVPVLLNQYVKHVETSTVGEPLTKGPASQVLGLYRAGKP